MAVQVNAELIRPANPDHGQHPANVPFGDGVFALSIKDASDAAHTGNSYAVAVGGVSFAMPGAAGGNVFSGSEWISSTSAGGAWR